MQKIARIRPPRGLSSLGRISPRGQILSPPLTWPARRLRSTVDAQAAEFREAGPIR
jgi:hypothetical protein